MTAKQTQPAGFAGALLAAEDKSCRNCWSWTGKRGLVPQEMQVWEQEQPSRSVCSTPGPQGALESGSVFRDVFGESTEEQSCAAAGACPCPRAPKRDVQKDFGDLYPVDPRFFHPPLPWGHARCSHCCHLLWCSCLHLPPVLGTSGLPWHVPGGKSGGAQGSEQGLPFQAGDAAHGHQLCVGRVCCSHWDAEGPWRCHLHCSCSRLCLMCQC